VRVYQDTWTEFLKIVKEEAGSRVVETWFKAVSFTRWDYQEKIAYLQAPNAFVQDWIHSNYIPLIEQHLKRLLSAPTVKIVFINDSNPPADTTQTVSVVMAQPATMPVKTAQAYVANQHALHKKKITGYRTYVFDTFVVGSNNALAYAAAKAVADKPGTIYNPLFIYGNSGLGKTHLLHAIGNEIKIHHKKAVILYQTADRFVNEFINAIRFDKVHQFQIKYKSVDVLLIDDIQFISNKDQTQEAFFHIFNALYDAHKQIVFSSDIFPDDMTGIADRLKYRLSSGLVVDMHMPPLETKIAILKKKAELHEEVLADDIAHFIASCSVANIRELEGFLIRVLAFASLTHQPLTLELAQKVLMRAKDVQKPGVSFEHIVKCIGKYYAYDLNQLRSKDRSKKLTFARQVAMFLMKKITDKPLRDIGVFLGGRDHSTVMHALDKVSQHAQNNDEFQNQLRKIEEDILS